MAHDLARDEELIQRLPLPLAQLHRRTLKRNSPKDQHNTAYCLWEASLKLLGASAVGAYIASGRRPNADLAKKLQNLARPSIGQWWEIVRALTRELASIDPAFAKIRDMLLGSERKDMPDVAKLDAALQVALDCGKGGSKKVKGRNLFDRFVQYRNEEFGHGAVGQKPLSHYEEVGRAMLTGLPQLLARLDVLAGGRLIYIREVRGLPNGRWQVDRYELTGESDLRLESLEVTLEQLPAFVPQRVYRTTAQQQWQSLHPLLTYEYEHKEALFLNASPGKQQVEYLVYTTGRILDRVEPAAQNALLGKLLNMQVDEATLKAWQARAQMEDGPGAPEEPPLRQLGEFKLLSVLGRGGMGVVYRAWQPSLGREVALKSLLEPEDPRALARFNREIAALGQVEHPHVVRIFSSGTDDGRWFYAMELVEGATLQAVSERLQGSGSSAERMDLPTWQQALSTVCDEARRKEKPLSDQAGDNATTALSEAPVPPTPPSEASSRPAPKGGPGYMRHVAELMRQVAEGAHALHEQGIIHRDIKPGNILVSPDGSTAMLADLGLAQLSDDVQGRLTQTRQFVGTLRYASPEQVLAVARMNRRADVYSLGATLWELLTLRPLYGATDHTPTPELMQKIQIEEPGRIRKHNPATPRDLEAVVHKCLEKNPKHRYATAAELVRDLGRFLAGEPVSPRPVSTLERAWKWARRRPTVSRLLAALAAAIIVGSAFGAWQLRSYLKEKEDKEQYALQKEQYALQLVEKSRILDEEKDAKLKAQAEAASLQEKNIQALEDKAKAEKDAKEAAEKRADFEKRTSNKLTHDLYFRQVAAAEREWLANNVGRARDLLADCPLELRNWEWQYVHRLCHADQITLPLPAHGMRVAFTSDGRRLSGVAVDSRSGGKAAVRFWDWQADPPRVLQTVALPADTNEAVASPDGKRLAVLSSGGDATLWDCANDKPERSFHLPGARTAAFGRDGKMLAVGGETVRGSDGKERADIRVWNVDTGKEVYALPGHSLSIDALAFSPDGRRLASGAGNLEKGEVKVWELAGQKELATFNGHRSHVFSVAFSPDGQRIASGGYDRTVKVWDAETGQEQLTLGGHINAVTSVAFSPADGKRLASGSWDQSVKVWDAQTGVEEYTLRGHAKEVSSVAFSPDDLYLASASWDGTVKVWDVAHSNPSVAMHHAESLIVSSLAYHPGGLRLAAAAQIGDRVMLWQPRMGVPFGSFAGRECVAYSPDGKYIAAAVEDGDKHFVKVWGADGGKEVCTLRGHEGEVKAVAFSPDGKQVVTGGQDGTVRVWDAKTGVAATTLSGHTGPVTSVVFCPDGRRVVSGSFDKTVRMWDVSGRGEPRVLEHLFPVRGVAVDRNGRRIAVAAGAYEVPGEVWVWDADDGKKLLALRGHTDQVNAVAFSPDGTRIASASHDKSVKLWDAASGEEVFTLRPFASAVLAVIFNADGLHIATGTRDGEVKDWDASPLDGAAGPDDPARKEFVAWLKANNKDGPRSRFVSDMSGLVDEEVYEGNNIALIIGSDHLKSGKATQACIFAGRFFAFELTEEQAKQLEIKPTSVRENTAKRRDHTQTPLLAELGATKIDDAGRLDGRKKITGRVAYRTLGPANGRLAMRLSYNGGPGLNRSSFDYLDKGLPDDKGNLDFSFSPINQDDGEKAYAGPLAVFIDLCTIIDRKDELPEIVLHSNTVGVPVQVTAK